MCGMLPICCISISTGGRYHLITHEFGMDGFLSIFIIMWTSTLINCGILLYFVFMGHPVTTLYRLNGVDITFQFFGAKNDGLNVRTAGNRLIERGRIGDYSVMATHLVYNQEPTLQLQVIIFIQIHFILIIKSREWTNWGGLHITIYCHDGYLMNRHR